MYDRTRCRSPKLLADMFFNSARHNNTEREVRVQLECTDNHLDKPSHQIFVIALIESINDNDHGPTQTGWKRISRCHHWLNNQSLELVFEILTVNPWLTQDDISNQLLGGTDGKGELIS